MGCERREKNRRDVTQLKREGGGGGEEKSMFVENEKEIRRSAGSDSKWSHKNLSGDSNVVGVSTGVLNSPRVAPAFLDIFSSKSFNIAKPCYISPDFSPLLPFRCIKSYLFIGEVFFPYFFIGFSTSVLIIYFKKIYFIKEIIK